MSDVYDGRWLRRWSLSDVGQTECAEDAVSIELISAEDRAAIEAKNDDIAQAIADVTELEASRLVPEPETTRTHRVYDDESEESYHMEPRPEWVAWDAAQATVAAAGDALQALESLRAGDQAAWPTVAARWGYSVPVSSRPDLPALWPADFKAILRISGYDEPLLAWADSIEDIVQREFARSRILNSAMYNRYDTMVLAGQQALGIPDQELDALWSWGAGAS